MLFLWLQRLKDLIKLCGFDRKKLLRPQQTLDRLKNVSIPRRVVSPSTVYASSSNVKSELKYKEKRMFYSLASW